MTSATRDTRRVLDAIRRLFRELRVTGRAAEEAVGMSGAQLFVLERLAEAPCGSVNDLAARTMTHQSSVSVVVERLVARGLVRRVRSPMDGRRRELTLSARGRTLLARSRPELAQDRLIDAVGALPSSTRAALASTLERVVADMGIDATVPPTLFFEEAAKRRAQSPRRGR